MQNPYSGTDAADFMRKPNQKIGRAPMPNLDFDDGSDKLGRKRPRKVPNAHRHTILVS